MGTFSAGTLEAGINLADYATPMLHQAQRVSWMVRDRDEAHYIHLRMRVRNADTGAQTGGTTVQDFENSLEDSIYEAAVPRPHVFRLTCWVRSRSRRSEVTWGDCGLFCSVDCG